MDAIHEFITSIKVGGNQSHQNMTLFPLLMSDAGEPGYMILEEALSKGAVEITEISQGGSVPELELINKSPQCVLIVDGDELMGAKQNRIVNATFLIAGNAEITIPVSCVEQGRWSYRTNKFSSGEKVMPPSMRRDHQEFVAMSLKEGRGYQSNQGMIWDELAMKSERMAVHSKTGAMADLLDGHKNRAERVPDGIPSGRLPNWRSLCNQWRNSRFGKLWISADLLKIFPKTHPELCPKCPGLV